MYRKILTLTVAVLLLCTGAWAYTGESDLSDTIRALKVMTGQANSEPILAGDHIDGDKQIGLGEAIYWMQDAAGIPYIDMQAQDYEEDFLLSALALEVTVGERQEIVILDTPRVGLDDNAYNREDLIITAIKGETTAQAEIEDLTDSVEDTYYYIRGLSEGVAVFQISYDGYSGQKPLVVVNVTAADAAGPEIETDITLTKYDTVYFTGAGADFTFTVTTDEVADVTAEVNGTVYTTPDGSFTVPLINGYNPIVISAAGSSGTTTEVINIRAKKCAITAVNTTRPNSDFLYEGDIIYLDVVGLITPVPKVSRIYNPAGNRVTYDTDMPRYSVISGGSAQYTVNNMEIELTAAGNYVLTNGHLEINVFGSPLYSEVPVGTQDPVLNAPQADYSFSVLPDITLTVLENPDYNPDLFTINITNTEDIWPGDEVTIQIPDLDIDTIDDAHQENDSEWKSTGLINSYTTFVTDIPGLDTVTSDSVDTNSALEYLRTLTFTIPEDTEPGTYKVRGGYVYVKYGPSWWTKVTYYYKGKIPDLTFEVVEAVPGQIHGVVTIESDTLKSRLAEALGLGSDYTGDLTTTQLKTITGSIDLSDSGITDEDMDLMQCLLGVTAINLSGNTGITSATVKKANFDWTLEKSLDFSGCTGLTELADVAFFECTMLTAITLPDTISAIGDNCFSGCTGLISANLPNGITSLGEECFSGCTGLASIVLPASLETLGDGCFYHCTGLTGGITIPDGVAVLGDQVFTSCINLETIGLPANLVSIGTECFDNCNSLTQVTLPDSVETIGKESFSSCDNLSEFTLSAFLTTIGEKALYNCDSLLLLTLTANIESIGTSAFAYGISVVDGRQSGFTTPYSDDHSWGSGFVFLAGTDAGLTPETAEFEWFSETLTLTADGIPSGETILWSSSDTDIAVVEEGVVTGRKPGLVLICARVTDENKNVTYGDYSIITVTDTEEATLSTLDLSDITLNETFDYQSYIYTADIAGDIRSTDVTLDATDSEATLTLNGASVTAGSATTVDLTYPETVLAITVTSADGLTKPYTVTIDMAAVTEKDNGEVAIGNTTLKDRLAAAVGRGTGMYTENLTITELATITGTIDLSDADLLNGDIEAMQYLTGVSAINLSGNTSLTETPSVSYFDWTTEKRLDFSGCAGIDGWGNSFKEVENLTGIVLPETVTDIAKNAFRDCIKLSSVTLPTDLEEIGNLAFYGCVSLTRIDLPEGLETLGNHCFRGLGFTDLGLPSTLTSIGENCFAECDALTALRIPASVTTIGESCFRDCTALAVLDLRDTGFTATDVAEWEVPVSTVVIYSTSQSAGLDTTTAELDAGGENLTLTHTTIPGGYSVGWATTNADVAVVSEDGVVTGVSAGTCLILVYSEDGTYFDYCEVTITETDTPGLSDISMTGGILHQDFVSERYYYTASGRSQVQIIATAADDASILTVNGSAVSSGTPTDTFDLSEGDTTFTVAVTTNSDVKNYTLLVTFEAVYEGETGVFIANNAFLKRLAVAAGKGENYTGPLTYEELGSITGELDLSGLDLTDEDMAVMKYLENVTTLNLSDNTALTAASATGAIFNWTLLGTLDFSGCTGITEIDDNAFEDYEKLSGIVLPDTVLSFGEKSFAETGFTTFEVPAGVTQIGEKCFSKCSSLTAFTVPAGTALKEIGKQCFYKCTSLETFTIEEGVALEVIGKQCFYKCSALATVTIPDNGALTELGDQCFSGCAIVSVTLPASVTTYGSNIFKDCESLTHADLSSVPINILSGTNGLFCGCTAITDMANISLPAGLTVLPESFFEGCEGITAINLPDTITVLGDNVFAGCGITEADISGMSEVGIGVFSNCTSLTHVVLPDDLTVLLDGFFSGCTALTNVDLPDSLTSTGWYSFMTGYMPNSTGGLEYLIMPAGVTSIGPYCFLNCNDLAILDLSATALTSDSLSNAAVPSTATILYAATDATLSATDLSLAVAGTATLTADGIPTGTSVTWISSNTDIVTVADGVVTAVGEGSALIAVVSDNEDYNGTCKVTVTVAE